MVMHVSKTLYKYLSVRLHYRHFLCIYTLAVWIWLVGQRQKVYNNNWKWYGYVLIFFHQTKYLSSTVSCEDHNIICQFLWPRKKGIFDMCVIKRYWKPTDKSPVFLYKIHMKYSTERAGASSLLPVPDVATTLARSTNHRWLHRRLRHVERYSNLNIYC